MQIRHNGSFKAYVQNFNAQMNATPNMDKFSRKCIFLGGIVKVGGRRLVQISKAS